MGGRLQGRRVKSSFAHLGHETREPSRAGPPLKLRGAAEGVEPGRRLHWAFGLCQKRPSGIVGEPSGRPETSTSKGREHEEPGIQACLSLNPAGLGGLDVNLAAWEFFLMIPTMPSMPRKGGRGRQSH